MRFLKVKDVQGLVRDTVTGAILNVDDKAFELHKKKKQEAKRKEDRINKLEQDVQDLKSGIKQILELLQKCQ